LVFHSSTITMMHGAINIRFTKLFIKSYTEIMVFIVGMRR